MIYNGKFLSPRLATVVFTEKGGALKTDNDQIEKSLIDVAVESWRFSRLFARVVSKLDAGESGRYLNQMRYFQKKVEESLEANGLKLVNVEGLPYDAGVAATALNLDDFAAEDHLIVDQMLEPIVMGPDGLRREGSVMLRKVQP